MTILMFQPVHCPDVTITPHPMLHALFETLAYAVGYALYRRARSRSGDILDDGQRWLIIAAAAVGALFGSRILGLMEHAPNLTPTWNIVLRNGGKTIVGGLLGGWIGVELIKRLRGIRSRTGDRVGCFLAGLADDTYGTPTSLPWAVDFGDGVPRHPTQLYEILFLIVLAAILHRYNQRPHPEGSTFRLFLLAYLTWRLFIDFIKPQPLIYGLNFIQWACVAGLAIAFAVTIIVAFGLCSVTLMRSTSAVSGPILPAAIIVEGICVVGLIVVAILAIARSARRKE
jgi:phosphatidylglycerol:prolipoprotein diacylglycerol transferase